METRGKHSCARISRHPLDPTAHSLEAMQQPLAGEPPAIAALRHPGTHMPTFRRQGGSCAQRPALAAPCSVKGCTTGLDTAETHSPTRWKALLYTSLRFATSFSILFRRGLRMRACRARSLVGHFEEWSRWVHSTCCCMTAAMAAIDKQAGLMLSSLRLESSGSALQSCAGQLLRRGALIWDACLTGEAVAERIATGASWLHICSSSAPFHWGLQPDKRMLRQHSAAPLETPARGSELQRLCRSSLCRCQACLPCEGGREVAVVAGVEGVDAAVPEGQVARRWLGTVLLPCSSRPHRSSSWMTWRSLCLAAPVGANGAQWDVSGLELQAAQLCPHPWSAGWPTGSQPRGGACRSLGSCRGPWWAWSLGAPECE